MRLTSIDCFICYLIIFNKSFIFLSFISSIFVFIFTFTSGITIVLNHIFSASFILFSKNITFFIFPVRDISQINIIPLEICFPSLLDMIDAARERSIHGSAILSPLDIFEYTSWLSSLIAVYFPSTATIRSSLDALIPLADLFGYPNLV